MSDINWTEHNLRKADGEWKCDRCGWAWNSKPKSDCPGLPRYSWSSKLDRLLTKTQLSKEGLKLAPAQPVRGVVQNGRGEWYVLYAKEEALPKRQPSPLQLEALAKAREAQDIARRKCKSCNKLQVSIDNLDKRQVCGDCNYEIAKAEWEAEQAWIEADGEAAAQWARGLLASSNWVVLDTETTGLNDAEVCQIAIVKPDGDPLLNSLVKPSVPIPASATAIHGITDEMVANAPTFPEIHHRIQQAIAGKQVIVFNAAFDRGILRYCCQLHGLPILTCKKWVCVMNWYAQWCGEWSDYYQDYRWQPLWGNHDALGDCQRVLTIIRMMAGTRDAIPIHETLDASEARRS